MNEAQDQSTRSELSSCANRANRRASSDGHASPHEPITDARWRAPENVEHRLFLDEHPQCRVTEDKWAELNRFIDWEAKDLFRRSHQMTVEDIRQEIVAGILECATYYRDLDEDGRPVFDFLEQAPSYIVRHAAGSVSSELRRRRASAQRTYSYDAPIHLSSDDGDGEEISTILADPSAVVDSASVELHELCSAIYARLRSDANLRDNTTTRQVWNLILTGHNRTDIGALLGLRRQRVHECVVRLRDVIAEIEPSVAA